MNTITYEYPCNDASRICLRLEALFNRINLHINGDTTSNSRTTMTALLEVLNVIDRPDLKSKLTQVLTQFNCNLSQLKQSPDIDIQALQSILKEISQAIDTLHYLQGRFGDCLRANPFLNQIRIHQSHPGGACDYSTPSYALWLRQEPTIRKTQLSGWFNQFKGLETIIRLILKLTRNSSNTLSEQFTNGFYQQPLKSGISYQIIRVTLPTDLGVFPEISVGKHRVCIRIIKPDYYNENKSIQVKQNIPFNLALCKT